MQLILYHVIERLVNRAGFFFLAITAVLSSTKHQLLTDFVAQVFH
jgi:hypothetical protein